MSKFINLNSTFSLLVFFLNDTKVLVNVSTSFCKLTLDEGASLEELPHSLFSLEI